MDMVNQGHWDVALLRRDALTGGRRWALGFAALVMLLTSLPYFLGYASQGQDWRFTGFVFGVEDGNSYIAKMQAGAAGTWLFRTPYSAVHQQGVVAFLPYILLGKLASPPELHEKLVLIYHIFRIAAGMLAILATYDFIAYFIPGDRERRYGLILAVLGGGLGWVLLLLGLDTCWVPCRWNSIHRRHSVFWRFSVCRTWRWHGRQCCGDCWSTCTPHEAALPQP
jgi:hypothetical protein